MDKFKILEFINDNKDSFKNKSYVASLNNIAGYAKENNIILDDEIISFLIKNSSTLRILLDKAAADSSDFAFDSVLSKFLAIYFSVISEEEALNLDKDDYSKNDFVRTYLQEIGQYQTLDEDVVRKLILIVKEDQDKDKVKHAVDTLIKHNLRLVVSIAKRYKRPNVEFLDLIQDGSEGLLVAIYKFDLDKSSNTKFSTYAFWWIRQKIMRNLAVTNNMAYHAFEDYIKYMGALKRYVVDYGCEPTDEEMADILNVRIEKIKDIKMSLPQVSSIEATLEDDTTKYTEIEFADNSIDEEIDLLCQKDDVKELLLTSGLTDREYQVICLRYGFVDGRPWTLDEIGQKFHVTRERIRVNEAVGLKKLRSSKNALKFSEESCNLKIKHL